MERRVKSTSLVMFFLTLLWIVLTAISMSGIDPEWSDSDYVKWIAGPDIFFILNYVNVILITILVVIFFSFLKSFLEPEFPDGARAGILFVPVYGVINLLCYSIQISVVPSLAASSGGDPGSAFIG